MSGWKLSMSLIMKHFGKAGDGLATAIAAFDPETATQVDRDALYARMKEISTSLADARSKLKAEVAERDELEATIANDEKAAIVLIGKAEKGEVDDSVLTEFTANLEAMKSKLPAERQDVVEAQELVDTLQQVMDGIEKNLADFDRNAQEAQRKIEQAEAEQQRQEMRLQNQTELQRLKGGLGGASTALSALNARAAKLAVEAEATKQLADIGQKPVDRANAVEEARKIAAGTSEPDGETAIERLRRIAGASASA